MPPKVVTPNATFDILENQSFEYQLILESGTTPVEWSLTGDALPGGMIIDSTAGILSWSLPEASPDVFTVKVQAQNIFGSVLVELQFNVLPLYTVRVSTSKMELRRPSPRFLFEIETLDINTLEPVGNKPAVFWVRDENAVGRRKIEVSTDQDGKTSRYYQPYRSDVGRFLFGGELPEYHNLTAQGSFDIRDITVSPQSYYFAGVTNDNTTLVDLFQFTFQGGSFTGINITIESENSFEVRFPLVPLRQMKQIQS